MKIYDYYSAGTLGHNHSTENRKPKTKEQGPSDI